MVRVWINRQEVNSLQLPHRGLAYGDGLFETIRVTDGILSLRDRHVARLTESSQKLLFTDRDETKKIQDEIDCVLQSIGQKNGILKLILLRDHGGRGYGFEINNNFDLIIEFYPKNTNTYGWEMNGLMLGVCQTPVSVNALLAGHKHLNRLDSVMATAEVQQKKWDDGLLLNETQVIETTSANIFGIFGNQIFTPALEFAGVKGVARSLILDYSKSVFNSVSTSSMELNQLMKADFIFTSNAVIIARPVKQLIWRDKTIQFGNKNQYFDQLIHKLQGAL